MAQAASAEKLKQGNNHSRHGSTKQLNQPVTGEDYTCLQCLLRTLSTMWTRLTSPGIQSIHCIHSQYLKKKEAFVKLSEFYWSIMYFQLDLKKNFMMMTNLKWSYKFIAYLCFIWPEVTISQYCPLKQETIKTYLLCLYFSCIACCGCFAAPLNVTSRSRIQPMKSGILYWVTSINVRG